MWKYIKINNNYSLIYYKMQFYWIQNSASSNIFKQKAVDIYLLAIIIL
jgi:hypothetical protein